MKQKTFFEPRDEPLTFAHFIAPAVITIVIMAVLFLTML